MGTETNKDDRNTPEYLAQLLKDKKQIQALPNVFVHVDKLLDEEINRVRVSLFHHQSKKDLCLPEALGPAVTLQEKLFVPVKDHPDFNFVGRILGPRGMTAKELEQYTGCKIMVRGKGSMRDKAKEEQNRGKANWEHLNEDLHVLITVEDTRNRAELKLAKAVEEVKRLLVPAPEGEDELKKKQLMELAILNGTYRDQKAIPMMHPLHALWKFQGPEGSGVQYSGQFPGQFPGQYQGQYPSQYQGLPWEFNSKDAHRFLAQPLHQMQMRTATSSPAGAPIILAPRLQQQMPQMSQIAVSSASMMNGAPPPLMSPPGDGGMPQGMLFNPYEHHYPMGLSAAPTILEYPHHLDPTGAAGAVPKMRRLAGVRDHPYNRVTLS
ncbi:KH domain-containing RNA-binding protein QKI-like isoform X2 [Littorina saxatilis]|uniref:KH domain-containing RNA-binding protein QKI-like isoform X2 n=1 Tax=Littorina saxatilis TaxID=31220 RepID=UPI0038B5B030